MRRNVIGIYFSNTEMANCWGKDTGNRWFNNIRALVPTSEDLGSRLSENVTIELTHDSSGCFVSINAEDIKTALNNVISKQYEDNSEEIWDGLVKIDNWICRDSEDNDKVCEPRPKMYGQCPCISRESLCEELKRFVKKFKSTILTNDKSKEEYVFGTIYYVATINAIELIVDFTHLCQIYNAQRIADSVHDLYQLGECLLQSQSNKKRKYVLMWFHAYDIVRDKYLKFVHEVLHIKRQSYKGQSGQIYHENKKNEISNETFEDWIDVECCHDDLWNWILKSMESVDYDDIKSSREKNSNAYDRWSMPESERLLSLYKRGSDIYSIAKMFNRSLTSIIIQLGKLLPEDMNGIKI